MSPSILIIDDDPSILETVADALADEGYTVRTASNGAEGIEAIDHGMPALVLLDMRMPVMDGWGFARALQERGIRLPLLVMTAAQDAQRWSREVGAVGTIAKPFGLDDLLGAVERALAGRA